ncbi:hypothetical protein BHE74_00017535 [Ensete ventricosum]|nr:hypothetical protein BHE74_00017535 [Ensete ventricosum]
MNRIYLYQKRPLASPYKQEYPFRAFGRTPLELASVRPPTSDLGGSGASIFPGPRDQERGARVEDGCDAESAGDGLAEDGEGLTRAVRLSRAIPRTPNDLNKLMLKD